MINLQLWKERKKALKLSLQDIANETGIALSTLKAIFRGATTDPRIETVQRIEKVLGISRGTTPAANALSELRLKAGLTQEEMAQILGISVDEIYIYELMEEGIRPISNKYLQIISKVFGVTITDILGKTENEIVEITMDVLDFERREIGRSISEINFLLSCNNTDFRISYYKKLPKERKPGFVYFLLYNKEDLMELKEDLLSKYYETNALEVYQEHPELWDEQQ